MLHPSYTELMEIVNGNAEEGGQPVVQSRYSIVMATAERAKQIIDSRYLQEKYDKIFTPDKDSKDKAPKQTMDEKRRIALGMEQIPNSDDSKPLSVAVEELARGKIKIEGNASEEQDN